MIIQMVPFVYNAIKANQMQKLNAAGYADPENQSNVCIFPCIPVYNAFIFTVLAVVYAVVLGKFSSTHSLGPDLD